MRAKSKSWLCWLVLGGLAMYSFVVGCALSCGASIVPHIAHDYLGGKPLPNLTVWFFELGADETGALLMLPFFSTLVASAYLLTLLRAKTKQVERDARFALIAVASFLGSSILLLVGVVAFCLPFIPIIQNMSGTNSGQPIITAPHSTHPGILIAFAVLGIANFVLLLLAVFRPQKPYDSNSDESEK